MSAGQQLDENGIPDSFLCLQRSHSKSKKHHRKKHIQAAPVNAEALNLMSSTYGAPGESFARPKRQTVAPPRKAEPEYSGGEDGDYV